MSVLVAIKCDECGRFSGTLERGEKRPPAHVLRREAKNAGWVIGIWSLNERGRGGSSDFCRECSFAYSAGDRGGVATPGPDDMLCAALEHPEDA